MTLVGLDLNATRARALAGPAGALPQPLPLDGAERDLPTALSLEGRAAEAGRAGAALVRRAPHLVCRDFLAHVGTGRSWSAGRHRLDAAAAAGLFFQRLARCCAGASAVALAVPAYLNLEQAELLGGLAEKARLKLAGTLPGALAAALAAFADQPWSGPAAVLDADDHALTWSAVVADGDRARLIAAHPTPQLGLGVWKERLLNAAADRCVRQTRRDPRDSAEAEQGLFEQLDGALDACRQGRVAELHVRSASWFQNLLLHADDVAGFCARLTRQAVAEAQSFLKSLDLGPPAVVLVTDAAGRLPGLPAALEDSLRLPASVGPREPSDDFGEDLLQVVPGEPARVVVLPPDAAARSAWELAGRWQRGGLPEGHLDAAPLLAAAPPDAGPARLHCDGRDYLLGRAVFTLGRQADCDLSFDSARYPAVSGYHCEIVFDRGSYVLRDRSRHGTLVNDRPVIQQAALHSGDWIRLGPGGPILRFLGRPADRGKFTTTA